MATARLRQFWGLNKILSKDVVKKNREDHRHHAVDALVVANTERKNIQHLSTYHHYKKIPQKGHFPLPWDTFRLDAEKSVNKILVSHKVKNKLSGALHKESLYGLIKDSDRNPMTNKKGQNLYGIKKSVQNLKDSEVRKIADDVVRISVKTWYALPKDSRSDFPSLPSGQKIKRVKIHDVHNNVVELRPGVFVEPGSNHHIAIFENIETGKRDGKVVSLFEAVQRDKNGLPVLNKTPDEGWQFIMTLSINEMVLVGDGIDEIDWSDPPNADKLATHLYRIQKMDINKNITLRKAEVAVLKNENGNEPGVLRKSAKTLRGTKVKIDKLNRITPIQ